MLLRQTRCYSLLQSDLYRSQGGERRRIVASGLLQYLLSRSAVNQSAAGRSAVEKHAGNATLQLPLRKALTSESFSRGYRDLPEYAGGYDLIDESQPICLGSTLRLSRQNHVQRGSRANQPRKSLAAARSGNQSELHLGEAEHRLGMIRCDPVVAGQRNLETAAQTSAVDGGDDGLLEGFQAADRFLALEAEPLGLRLIGDRRELLDVGTGDEVVGLAGDEHNRADGGVFAQPRQQ